MIKFIKFLGAVLIVFAFGIYIAKAEEHHFNQTNLSWDEVVKHTQDEEQAGKALWEKFSNKEISCSDLKDDDFDSLGEYFMGKMLGQNHAAMNLMMMQMHGAEGERQMHIVMGKRFSGCDEKAVYPFEMPMMGSFGYPMMGFNNSRSWSAPFDNLNNSMMNMMNFGWQGFGFWGILGWIFMLAWWVLIIVAVVVLIKWLLSKIENKNGAKNALEILAQRYAKGEISQKEFEEKKKELEELTRK